MRISMSGNYVLKKEITFPAPRTNGFPKEGFIPIGTKDTKFTGSFDGKNHTIYNFYINHPSIDYVGLFGFVTNTGEIFKNVYFEGSNVVGRSSTGTFIGAGDNNLGITHIGLTRGKVKTTGLYTGGLIGGAEDLSLRVSDCFFEGSIEGNASVGGLVGILGAGFVTKSYVKGTVKILLLALELEV